MWACFISTYRYKRSTLGIKKCLETVLKAYFYIIACLKL